MKDYSTNKREKAVFILNYEIVDNEIIINFANKERGKLPYTKENEDTILDIMKMQVLNTEEITDEIMSNSKYLVIPFGIIGYGSFITIVNNIIDITSSGRDFSTIDGAIPFMALCLSIGLADTITAIKYYSVLRDIDKNYLFMENNYYMNFNMRKEDKYLEGLSAKAKRIINSVSDEENTFTFNTIDKMSYKDVKTVLENIERYNPKDDDYTPRFKQRKRR